MGIKPTDFFQLLNKNGIKFFTGVPDSLLKNLCLCIDDNVKNDKHLIAANEGNAVALASGYHLATKKLGLVYMQNSGIGNAINPLLSLADPEVYSIPMLLLIGWRGEPGVKDEPQHIKQGKVQLNLLDAIDIPYEIFSSKTENWDRKLVEGIKYSSKHNRPFAIIIKKGTFDNYFIDKKIDSSDLMTREEALKILLENIPNKSVIVSTTGKTSREIFEIREQNKESHHTDFLTVGSMGHCSSIALGIALAQQNKKVFCIDGDGSLLMHLGSLAVIGKMHPKNFYHILMNNNVHESVGGQKTAIDAIDIKSLIKSTNYNKVICFKTKSDLKTNVKNIFNSTGPNFIEIRLKSGSRADLGRPTIKPIDNKKNLMDFLKDK